MRKKSDVVFMAFLTIALVYSIYRIKPVRQEEYDRGYVAAMDSIKKSLEENARLYDTVMKIRFAYKNKVVYFVKPRCIEKK